MALLRSTYRRTAIEAVREETITDHESITSAVSAAVAGFKADSYAVALPGDRVFIRRVDLPTAAQRELDSVLSYEVESTLPFELDDAVMDHKVLRRVAGVDPRVHLPILAAVAYTHEVSDRINLIRRATGQEPNRVSAGSLALANLGVVLPELRAPNPVAILCLGTERTDLVVLRNGEPHFTRSLSIGTAVANPAAQLAAELRRSLAAWRGLGGEALTDLYVVGSGSQVPGLDTFAQNELGLQLRALPALPFEQAPPGGQVNIPSFAVAIGLALGSSRRAIDLNLRRGPLEAQQSFQFLREKTPLLAGLATAMLVSFGFSLFAQMRSLSAERAMLEEQLAQATRAAFGEPIRDPVKAQRQLDRAMTGRSDDPLPQVDAFGVMVELSKRVSKDITHDVAEFDYNRGSVAIKGMVPTIDDAHAVAAEMAKHPCFQNVKKPQTTQLRKENKQKYVLEFEVQCETKKKPKKRKKKSTGAGKNKSTKGATR